SDLLDKMVSEFVTAFNEQHKSGYGLNGVSEIPFFANVENEQGAAGRIVVANEIMTDLDNIAAASPIVDENEVETAYPGDGSNALALANIKDKLIFDGTARVQSFYKVIIGELAVDTSEVQQKMFNTDDLRDNVDFRRKQVTSVSLDEEFTNLIQYQHAYNAAARNITAVDEMLDRIINNMGIVGR